MTKIAIGVASVLAAVCICGAGARAIADDRVTGWRGDGTGLYPLANPPTHWTRTSTGVKTLRFQAESPDAQATGTEMTDGVVREWLAAGPVPRRDDWTAWVNRSQTAAEVAALQHCLRHGRPYGSESWTAAMESTLKLPRFPPSVWVASGGYPPEAPAVPYVRALAHTVPHLMDSLRVGESSEPLSPPARGISPAVG